MINRKTGEQLAVMANSVAEARHSLSIAEQRLILWLIAQIDRKDDVLKDNLLTVSEFKEILGGNAGRLYEQMESACDRLQTRVLELRTSPTERVKFNWMHRVRYLDGEGKIVLRFHDDLKPLLLLLKERFCRIPLKAAFQLQSGYAIRWLEILYAREKDGIHDGKFYLTAC